MQADNKISQGLSCFFLTVAVLRLNLDFIMRLKASELEHIFLLKTAMANKWLLGEKMAIDSHD